jgi:hypothetical protein
LNRRAELCDAARVADALRFNGTPVVTGTAFGLEIGVSNNHLAFTLARLNVVSELSAV